MHYNASKEKRKRGWRKNSITQSTSLASLLSKQQTHIEREKRQRDKETQSD